MLLKDRLNYYHRIFAAYMTPMVSQLTFWHEVPEVNERAKVGELGEYYMPFTSKAHYSHYLDRAGIPLLNYRGKIGLQYNPIAIAQYALGNYNIFCRDRDKVSLQKFLNAADWLVNNLQKNKHGVWVWNHLFDWEYRNILKAPWYSALSQGQGISVLVRAHKETGKEIYMDSANKALESFFINIDNGGVLYEGRNDFIWFEEYIVDKGPATHVLNGFMWAMWGLYDYYLHCGKAEAKHIFDKASASLKSSLHDFDIGFWSLYEQSGVRLRMPASPFYHNLHIIQLKVMHRLTNDVVFMDWAQRWEKYKRNWLKRMFVYLYKIYFKLLYY